MSPQTTPGESLPIETASDVLLLLLYAPGRSGQVAEPIEGTTRLQKLFFLLRQGEGPGALVEEAQELTFEPYKMGPFSSVLRDTVEELEAAGIIKTEPLEYLIPDDEDVELTEQGEDDMGGGRGMKRVQSRRYRLSSNLGTKIGEDLWAQLGDREKQEMTEFKKFFGSLSLRQLLIFTYEKFPDYTERSTIKDQLGFD